MNTSNTKVLDKIRALFAKTTENGASESEMEQALIAARKLMAKYSIDESEVVMSKDDISEELIEESNVGEEHKMWQWDLLDVIGKGYNCKVTRKGGAKYFWRVTGFTEDKMIVKAIFEAIVPQVRALYKRRYKDYKSTTENPVSYGVFVRNYIVGFTSGLQSKLEKSKKDIFQLPEESAQYQLIVVKKDALVDEYLADKFKTMNAAKTNFNKDINSKVQMIGYNDGAVAEDKKQLH